MVKVSNLFGSWAFLIGVVLALVVGIFSGLEIADLSSPMVTAILVVIGLVVGLFNITAKESMPFLLSGIVLILASFFGISILSSVAVLSATLVALMMIFVPATIIVAIRNVFSMAKQ